MNSNLFRISTLLFLFLCGVFSQGIPVHHDPSHGHHHHEEGWGTGHEVDHQHNHPRDEGTYDLPVYYRGYRKRSPAMAVPENMKSAVNSAHQKIDSFVSDLKQQGTPPSTSAVTAFVSGIDAQIDNLMNTVASATTGGDYDIGALLGPTLQSLADGIRDFIVLLAGTVLDPALTPRIHELSSSLGKVSSLATNSNMKDCANQFNVLKEQVAAMASKTKKSPHHITMRSLEELYKRATDPINKAAQEITFAKNEIDSLIGWLKSEPQPPNSAAVKQFAKSFESELNDAIKATTDAMGDVGQNTKVINSALLGPLFQSASNGVEVMISTLPSVQLDKPLSDQFTLISTQMDRLSTLANNYDLIEYSKSLNSISHKLKTVANASVHSNQADKAKRQLDIIGGIMSGFSDAQQRLDAITNDLKDGGDHPTEDVLSDSISGINDQIDNLVGMVSSTLEPLDGGKFGMVELGVLEPTFQSVSDGAEMIIGKIGPAADAAVVPAVHALASNLNNLSLISGNYKMDDLQQKFARQSQVLTHSAVQGQKANQHKSN